MFCESTCITSMLVCDTGATTGFDVDEDTEAADGDSISVLLVIKSSSVMAAP